jgi:hypothetical protein
MPNNATAAASERARQVVGRLGFEPVGNPLAQLASVAGELVAIKDFLRSQVERLSQIRTVSAEGSEQLRAELTAYQQSLRDTVSVLAQMARLNIDERMAKLNERQVEAMEAAVRATLAEPQFGLGLAEQDQAAQSLGRRLRAV